MAAEQDDFAWLEDMVIAGDAVMRHVAGKTRADLDSSELLRDAIERRIEIFGEAARHLSDALQQAHPEIPWRKIMGTRHILAHDYDEINYDVIWRIATEYLPETLAHLRKILPPPDPQTPQEKGSA